MGIHSRIKKMNNDYVIRQVHKIVLPFFDPSPVVQKHIVFYGRVQKVGFRLEVFELAKKLGLCGWVRNRKDGAVETQIKGEENKIRFLIQFMNGLKRARVSNIEYLNIVDDQFDHCFEIKEDF